MPRLSAFDGITVWMYYADHAPPHIHVRYADNRSSVDIRDGSVIAGALPERARRLVHEWVRLHYRELEANWGRAHEHEPLQPIAGLP